MGECGTGGPNRLAPQFKPRQGPKGACHVEQLFGRSRRASGTAAMEKRGMVRQQRANRGARLPDQSERCNMRHVGIVI